MNRIVNFICKRDFTIDKQRARHFVKYSEGLSTPLPLLFNSSEESLFLFLNTTFFYL